MTNREAIEYIERECHTCKGFMPQKKNVLNCGRTVVIK